jgi:hypothetical protein
VSRRRRPARPRRLRARGGDPCAARRDRGVALLADGRRAGGHDRPRDARSRARAPSTRSSRGPRWRRCRRRPRALRRRRRDGAPRRGDARVDSLHAPWAPRCGPQPLGAGVVRIRVEDEARRLDLGTPELAPRCRRCSRARPRRAPCRRARATGPTPTTCAPARRGARLVPRPRRPRTPAANEPLRTLGELRLVRGVDAECSSGSAPHVTVAGERAVNRTPRRRRCWWRSRARRPAARVIAARQKAPIARAAFAALLPDVPRAAADGSGEPSIASRPPARSGRCGARSKATVRAPAGPRRAWSHGGRSPRTSRFFRRTPRRRSGPAPSTSRPSIHPRRSGAGPQPGRARQAHVALEAGRLRPGAQRANQGRGCRGRTPCRWAWAASSPGLPGRDIVGDHEDPWRGAGTAASSRRSARGGPWRASVRGDRAPLSSNILRRDKETDPSR